MLKTRPLSDVMGVIADEVDLTQPLDEAAFAAIEAAFHAGLVMVFPGQRLTPSQFHAFARRFGKPEPHVIAQFHHPETSDILILSNVRRDGQPIGLADGGTYWHTDYSYLPVPAKATLLHSIQVPSVGGNTRFTNMVAAYDDLSEAMKRRIDGLIGLHHYGNRDVPDENSRIAASKLTDDQKARMTFVHHPVVRVHPYTGRKALYAVSGSSYGIVGMPQGEAIDLLDELKAHATQPGYEASYFYGEGDVLIWDNLAILHAATLVDPNDPRTLHRITIKEPIGAWA